MPKYIRHVLRRLSSTENGDGSASARSTYIEYRPEQGGTPCSACLTFTKFSFAVSLASAPLNVIILFSMDVSPAYNPNSGSVGPVGLSCAASSETSGQATTRPL